MPAWLMPPQILLLAAPIAMLLAALALSAGERRASARRAREALGPPRRRVEEGAAGEHVVLEGRLDILEDACARFEDGREAAATTVESAGLRARPPVNRGLLHRDLSPSVRVTHSARAGVLVLACGKENVLVEGPVEVAVGTDETDPAAPFHALSASVRDRIAAATGGASLPEGGAPAPVHAIPLFRSLRGGVRVRAAGVLAKDSDGPRSGYRERARWTLAGTEEAPVVLAFDGTPRHRGSTGALVRGVRRFEWARVATALAGAATLVGGLAFAIGRPPRRPAKPTVSFVSTMRGPQRDAAGSAPKGTKSSAAEMAAKCAQPRPTALPEDWRCVGEAQSFTMYLPPATVCADPADDDCMKDGYRGGGIRLRAHFDASEVDLDAVERQATMVEIDGVPARVARTRGTITLVFEENGTGIPPHAFESLQSPRLAFDVVCESDRACKNAWLALQTIRLW